MRVQRRAMHLRAREDRERRVLPARGFRDHPERFVSVRRGDDGDAGFDDARLLRRDAGQRFPQPLLMIVLDVGDDAGQRRDDIGGVQPSAQTGFPDHQIALLLGEIAQRHDRHDLKEGRMLGTTGICVSDQAARVARSFPHPSSSSAASRHQPPISRSEMSGG